eukprot:m.83066 g.83066  ORF g.83066 m.83066 type:complete len:474 (-) comp11171_c0_seq4:93-1514(-)
MVLLLAAMAAATAAGGRPNTSLATVPVGYFGGNTLHRGDANIAMLAKLRIVMIEKWEGHCWADCLANSSSPACLPSCNEEGIIIDTHRRIKAINPGVSSVMYLNTLLDFPYYHIHGVFAAANALTIDSVTKKPISIRNDNGMEGINVFGFDTEAGVQLYIEAIKNITASGVIDGFFGDKWAKGASQNKNGSWSICNKECGSVTASQAAAWNAGKQKVLAAVTAEVGDGPYYQNGGDFQGVGSNFAGYFNTCPWLRHGDPRDGIASVLGVLANHTYGYFDATGDQHDDTDPNDPATLQGTCTGDCLARFLLAVEEGAFLGADGWDETYGLPLGNPLGPATYTAATRTSPATLHRNFSSGTYVHFTYDASGVNGSGVVFWGGHPRPPTPPPPPPPTVPCGAYRSTTLNNTQFAADAVARTTAPSAEACCEACGATPRCADWTWFGPTGTNACHQMGPASKRRSANGVVAGVIVRT